MTLLNDFFSEDDARITHQIYSNFTRISRTKSSNNREQCVQHDIVSAQAISVSTPDDKILLVHETNAGVGRRTRCSQYREFVEFALESNAPGQSSHSWLWRRQKPDTKSRLAQSLFHCRRVQHLGRGLWTSGA